MRLFLFLFLGLLLGPSVLKINYPTALTALGPTCANLFLFVAGLELSLKAVRKQLRPAAQLSLGAFILPFMTGLFSAFIVLRDTPLATFSSYIFLAVALAVSALPIAIQLLKDLDLYHSDTGRLIIATATICDVLAWIAFAFVIPGDSLKSWLSSHIFIFFFFFGLIISDTRYPSERVRQGLQKMNALLFGPVFFVSIGWKLNLWQNLDWAQVFILFVLASVSKLGGSYWMARNMGSSKKRSVFIGLALNARGAIEIIIASIALQQHLISEKIFATLIVIAVLTSLIPEPVTHLLKLSEE